MINSILQTSDELEFFEKVLEVTQHPAWRGAIDEGTAIALLQPQPPMTYLIRQDLQKEYHYWLSHKKATGEFHHRHFMISRFSDGYLFQNYQAPPSEDLDRFIQGALACKD